MGLNNIFFVSSSRVKHKITFPGILPLKRSLSIEGIYKGLGIFT